jgi:hypothetical protein
MKTLIVIGVALYAAGWFAYGMWITFQAADIAARLVP